MRRRLVVEDPPKGDLGDPLMRLRWSAARDAVGVEVSVLVEESSKVLLEASRDAVTRQVHEITTESRRLARHAVRDDIAQTTGFT